VTGVEMNEGNHDIYVRSSSHAALQDDDEHHEIVWRRNMHTSLIAFIPYL